MRAEPEGAGDRRAKASSTRVLTLRRALAAVALIGLVSGSAVAVTAALGRSTSPAASAAAAVARQAVVAGVIAAVETGASPAPAMAELDLSAEQFRQAIDAVLFDAQVASQSELDAALVFATVVLALAGALLVALVVVAIELRRARRRAAAPHVDPNGRGLLTRALGEAISRAARAGDMVGMLLADIDLFKIINDRYGPEVGDDVLGQVGDRIRRTVRDSDTVARMGGDEFAIVVEGLQRPEEAGRVAENVLAALALPFEVGGRRLYLTASIGIVLYPLDGVDADELLREADVAMYAAKESGRDRYQFSTHELRERTSERLSLVEGLRRATDRSEELELFYQPRVDMISGDLVGVEALLRWHHPELGTLLPDRFISVAEETDLIVPLGRWVIGEACAQAERWRRAGLERLNVSVNVSSRQFRSGDLVETIAMALTASGLDPRWLEVELTEGTLADDVAVVRRTLERLKAVGVRVSIDDFGTGYSSLGYLKRLPIDSLKIDRSFISDIARDPDDAAISQAIVSLARSLRLSVVAEGVETTEQLDLVRELGCDAVQGFLISEPLPADRVQEFVLRRAERAVV